MPKDKEILIYDRQGARSRQAFEKLKAAGFTVSELSGGLAGWVKRKLPLEVK
jgi:rhodanese-related sulfurtransferase